MIKKTKRIRIVIITLAAALIIMAPGSAVSYAADNDAVTCFTKEEASEVLREAMKERRESAGICLTTNIEASDSEKLIGDIFEGALEHTGDPEEGDYLKFQYESCQASAKPVVSDGENAVLFTYSLSYYDTEEQADEVSRKSEEIIDGLELEGKTDEQKAEAVYDYICSNVEYDYDNLPDDDYKLKHTAYAALVDGKAVCQGYSAALYRLLLEAGVDNRIVIGTDTNSGKDDNHTWNIVRIDGTYYNTDVTRDAETDGKECFLRGSGAFDDDHIRQEDYQTEAFTDEYKMSESDYEFESEDLADQLTGFALNVGNIFQRLLDSF